MFRPHVEMNTRAALPSCRRRLLRSRLYQRWLAGMRRYHEEIAPRRRISHVEVLEAGGQDSPKGRL